MWFVLDEKYLHIVVDGLYGWCKDSNYTLYQAHWPNWSSKNARFINPPNRRSGHRVTSCFVYCSSHAPKEEIMSQQYSTTRTIDEHTFVASRVNPVQNPLSRGLSPNMRLDYLDLTIRGTLSCPVVVPATSELTFDKIEDFNNFLDCLYSNIRFYSSVVGDPIRNLSLSELVFLVGRVNADMVNTNLPTPGGSVTFLSGNTFTLNISIPFRLDNQAILSQYAGRAAQWADGGLSSTCGGGNFTESTSGVAWSVSGTTRCEWRLRGPEVQGVDIKSSPICYEKYTTTGIAELPSGLWLTLDNFSDSAVDAYGATGGASAGCRIDVDGTTTVNMNDFAPIDRVSSMIQEGPDPAAWDANALFSSGTLPADYIWDRPGVPIVYLPVSALTFGLLSVNKRLVIEPGNNWSSTIDYLGCRVKRLSEIGDAPRCGSGMSGAGITVPAPSGPTSESTVKFQPQQV